MEILQCNLPVQTLCITSTMGDLKPLWFRYEDNSHSIIKVNILNILSCKESKIAGCKSIVFTCEAVLDDNLAIVELQYLVASHKWMLKKKVA